MAVALTDAQRSRLRRPRGHLRAQVHLNVVLDPRVTGGMTVRVGDELIDGSVATRLGRGTAQAAPPEQTQPDSP